jgi:multidrug transporter EmrE-like cation transporter
MEAAAAYILLLLALLATALAQVSFKHYHLSGQRSSLVVAVLLFACIPPVTFLAVRELGVGKVYVLTSLSYGLVAFLGWKVFKEGISRRQLTGLAIITLGCLIYTF